MKIGNHTDVQKRAQIILDEAIARAGRIRDSAIDAEMARHNAALQKIRDEHSTRRARARTQYCAAEERDYLTTTQHARGK